MGISVHCCLRRSQSVNPVLNHFNVVYNVTHYPFVVPFSCYQPICGCLKWSRPSSFIVKTFLSLIFSVDAVYNFDTPSRQSDCYGFSESCSHHGLALHVAIWNARTLNIQVDVPETGSEPCTVANGWPLLSRLYKTGLFVVI
jgi:hypothetical protein